MLYILGRLKGISDALHKVSSDAARILHDPYPLRRLRWPLQLHLFRHKPNPLPLRLLRDRSWNRRCLAHRRRPRRFSYHEPNYRSEQEIFTRGQNLCSHHGHLLPRLYLGPANKV